MATTSAGDPTRIASVKRLRTRVSSVRWVRTPHCVSPLATGRLIDVSGTVRRAPARVGCGAGRGRRVPSEIGQAAVELGRPSSTPKCSSASSTVPTKPTRPPRAMNTMRSHSARSSTECVVNTTVAERSASCAQAGDQLRARDRVEARRRLVEEEDVRIGEQLDGDAGALALPAAQRADPDVGVIGQAHGVDRVTRPRRRPRPRWSTTGAAAARRSGACGRAAGRRG